MKEKISVLIPDGEDDDLPVKVLRCLSQVPNINVSVLSRENWTPIRFSKHRRNFFSHNIDSFDRERLDVILQTAKKINADIILPVAEPAIRLIAKYRDEVESVAALPPLASPELIDKVSDKWLLAEFLEQENIPYPATVLYQSGQLHGHDFTSLIFPVLIKPLEGAGGVGIRYFNDLTELTNYLKNEAHPDRLIIQSFIRGYDIDCSVLCQNGEILAYTIQKASIPGKKRFEPALSIEFLYNQQVYDVIKKLMLSLNWSGIAHIDLRYDEIDNQPKIIEINPRYWGTLLGSLVAGINFPHLACLTSMKIDFQKPEYQFISYTKPEIAVKLLIKKYLKGDNTIRKLSDTGLPFTIRDPFPELQKELIKISKKVFQKTKKKT